MIFVKENEFEWFDSVLETAMARCDWFISNPTLRPDENAMNSLGFRWYTILTTDFPLG